MPEWIAYANLALNVLIIPLLAVLWRMSISISKLEVQTENCASETKELRGELSSVKEQVTNAALAAATAATAMATAMRDKYERRE